MTAPLSEAMAEALEHMRRVAREGTDPQIHGVIANTMSPPYVRDGVVWMSIATGRALERRGLIKVRGGTYATVVE